MSEKSKKSTKSSAKASATKSSKSTTKKTTKKPAVKATAPIVKTDAKTTVKETKPAVKKQQSSEGLLARAKKIVSKQAKPSASTDSKQGSRDSIRKILLVSAGLFAFYAVMTLVLAKQSLTGTEAVYFTLTDPLALNPAQLQLGIKDILTYDIRYVFSALFAVSAVVALLFATKWRAQYEKTLGKNTSLLRWIYAAISSVIVIKIVNLTAGVSDMSTLKMSCGLLVIAAFLGYISEQVNESSNKPRKLEFGLAVFAGFLAFLPATQYLIGTYYYGVEYMAWYVYAIFAVAAATYIAFALNHYKQITGAKKFIDAERRYFAIDLVSKTLLYAVIVLALYK